MDTNNIVSRYSLGTMMFGWKVPLLDAFRLLDVALNHGINIIDTSPTYGDGLSEIICGNLIKKNPQLQVSTKFNLNLQPLTKNIKEHIKESCQNSLRNLNKEKIDYYVLHNDLNVSQNIEVLCDAIFQLKEEKLIEKFFISNSSKSTYNIINIYERVNNVKILDGLQVRNNILFQDSILKSINSNYIDAIHVYSPLCEGLLTGKYIKNHSIPFDSRVAQATKNLDYYKELICDWNLTQVNRLIIEAAQWNLTLIEYAYIKLLQDSSNSKIIVGPAKLSHLVDAIECEKKWKSFRAEMKMFNSMN